MNINEAVEKLVNNELNNGTKKLISKIDDSINFRYNSFNICVGPQGSSKTCSVMKELIKLGFVKNHDYHLIVYVSNTDSDDTVNSLSKHIKIPVVKIDYEHIEEYLSELITLKDKYNKIIDCLDKGIYSTPLESLVPLARGDECKEAENILINLFVNDFKIKRLHTFILFDDAAFVIGKKDTQLKRWLCQLRHLNFTVFCCLQIFNSIDPKIKSQLSSVWIFKGFSRERINYIYRQTPNNLTFNEFCEKYFKLKKYQPMIVDTTTGEVSIL